MKRVCVALMIAIFAGCTKPSSRTDTATARSDTSRRAMAGMADMATMMSAGMMDSMKVQMSIMDTMTGAQMKTMMPAHRQMVANLLAQMNSEMRGMNMPADPRWTALMDSVRGDLVRMPDLSAQQGKEMMPAHQGRVTRLMQLHRDMIVGMKK